MVELGGGTGAVTKALLAKLHAHTRLIVLEVNPEFCEVLKALDDPRLTVVNASAESLPQVLAELAIQSADYVVSTVPLTILDNPVRLAIINAAKEVMAPDASYIQIAYSTHLRKLMYDMFKTVHLDFSLLHIPPTFFYICRNR